MRFRQYLLEANIVLPISQYEGGKLNTLNSSSFFPALTADNPSGIGITIVANPNGESSTRSSLGMGFDIAPHLTGTVQQFLNQYGDKEDNNAASKEYSEKIKSKFSLPPQDTVLTWQSMNKAVANHQEEELNKLLVKHNLKTSDTPPRSPEHEEWEEYDRWLEKQLEEWERSNPPPVWTEDMTQEEWDILLEDWLFERELYTDSQEQWYLKNTGRENLPRPDPKPKPRPRAPTWSPKPWWAGEIPPNNPNWWHWGPDGSDTVMGLNNNVPQLLSQGGPQNNPGYKPPYQNPDGTWQSPFPQDWQPDWELSPDRQPPPVVFNPADPSNPPTYDEWLRQHPEPKDPQDPDIDFQKMWDAWQKAWQAAQRWYNEEQRRRKERGYYSAPGVGVGRGINDFTREILPDFLNPFGN